MRLERWRVLAVNEVVTFDPDVVYIVDAGTADVVVVPPIPPRRMVEGPSPYFQPPKGAQWKRERAPFNRR